MTIAPARVWEAWQAEPAHKAVESTARELGLGVWLVGGAVRDALLGLPVSDWDLAATQAAPLAEALAEKLACRPVLLHEDTPTYRLTSRHSDGPPRQFDVVELRAGTIAEDLLARDLSLNALAADPLTCELLDPSGGLEDLQCARIRALGLPNLQSDPLRCLRVYRFHSQLGFALDQQTRDWVRLVAPRIVHVAGERVGEELLKVLRPPRAAQTLRLMDEDGLLAAILPEINPTRGVEQGRYHHLDVWEHTLEVVAGLEEIMQAPGDYLPRAGVVVEEYLRRERLPSVLLLTAVLHDLGKPPCRKQDEAGWWRFFDHDVEGARLAGQIAGRLALRRDDAALVRSLIRNHLRPLQLANLQVPQDGRPPQEITLSALRRLFRDASPDGLGLLLLALADARGCCGPATSPEYHERLAAVLDEMLWRFAQYREVRVATPLITGQDLIEAGHRPGPRFGEVLAEIEDAWADGIVRGRQEALNMASELFAREAGQRRGRGE